MLDDKIRERHELHPSGCVMHICIKLEQLYWSIHCTSRSIKHIYILRKAQTVLQPLRNLKSKGIFILSRFAKQGHDTSCTPCEDVAERELCCALIWSSSRAMQPLINVTLVQRQMTYPFNCSRSMCCRQKCCVPLLPRPGSGASLERRRSS